QDIARGLVNYDMTELARIKGLKNDDIAAALGYTRSQTVIHRDNMVLSRQPDTAT
ncbi:MAG: glutamate 5-kinase, partial [Pseudomonadota bacterium]